MVKKIGINGFGRIGRLVFKNSLGSKSIEVVAINDLTDAKTAAHLLKYDSTYGRFNGTVEVKQAEGHEILVVNGKDINYYHVKAPEDIPWEKHGIEIVYESTGVFTTKEACAKHIKGSVRRVVLSAPSKGEVDATIVYGVNNDDIKPDMKVISAASCTTNCLAPVAKVLDEKFGIVKGFMTTIHAFTNDQRTLDFPHSDLRRARTASSNIIPTSTGAAKAVGLVLPGLKGKLDGVALRVPVVTGSAVDLVVELKTPATKDEINKVIKEAAEGALKETLGYTEDPIVSTDTIGITVGSLFDAKSTMVMGNMAKILTWYDNESSFVWQSIRLLERLA
jgi:glyceraldehyde 3-phosphate dehydrogenase